MLGTCAAHLLSDDYREFIINWPPFREVTFASRVTPALLALTIVFATAIGIFGGLFPAIRAARHTFSPG